MGILNDFLESDERECVRIACVGDALVDEYHYAAVKRISPEFPIPVMLSPSQTPDYSLPGGAANVAYQMRHFNVNPGLASLIDRHSLEVFKKAGLDVSNSVEMVFGYGHVPRKKRFYNKDFPMFRWDIEQPKYGLDDDHLFEYISRLFSRVPDCDVVILSDYDKGVYSDDSHRKFIGAGIPTIVDPKGKNIDKWKGCTVFKPNSMEAETLSGEKGWELQCNYFRERLGCHAVVITQEGDGVVGLVDAEYFEYRPKAKVARAESVIGAGDCFIAFLAMAMAHGFPVAVAAEIAFEAGSLYVRRKHNEPITPRQLRLKDDPIRAKFAPPEEIKGHPRLVFTNGCFDLLHAGHAELLKFAKSKGDRLVVAVNTDASVGRLKPGRPYTKLEDRMEMLACLEMVDYVVSFDEDTPIRLIEQLAPDVLVKGAEYKPEDIVGAEIVKEVYVAPMVKDASTSRLIHKIRL